MKGLLFNIQSAAGLLQGRSMKIFDGCATPQTSAVRHANMKRERGTELIFRSAKNRLAEAGGLFRVLGM
jgi:hypothetical protein